MRCRLLGLSGARLVQMPVHGGTRMPHSRTPHALWACRCEGERVQLQQQNESLRQQVKQLHGHRDELAAQLHALCSTRDSALTQRDQAQQAKAAAEVTRDRAVAEFRANEIIAVGLRDTVATLQRLLQGSQSEASQQVRSATACQPGCTPAAAAGGAALGAHNSHPRPASCHHGVCTWGDSLQVRQLEELQGKYDADMAELTQRSAEREASLQGQVRTAVRPALLSRAWAMQPAAAAAPCLNLRQSAAFATAAKLPVQARVQGRRASQEVAQPKGLSPPC